MVLGVQQQLWAMFFILAAIVAVVLLFIAGRNETPAGKRKSFFRSAIIAKSIITAKGRN